MIFLLSTRLGWAVPQGQAATADTTTPPALNVAVSPAPAPAPVQSIYYDALSLYYALCGYKAYPLYVSNHSKSVVVTPAPVAPVAGGPAPAGNVPASGNGAGRNPVPGGNPGAPAGNSPNPPATQTITVGTYMIIESASGKTLNDNCDGDTLAKTMDDTYKFRSPDDDQEKADLINSIMARNEPSNDNSAGFTAKLGSLYKANSYLVGPNSALLTPEPKNAFINITGFSQNIATGEGLPSVQQLSEGLAEFYIQQVNAEINEAFFVHLKDILSSIPEIRILFPNTLASLSKIQVTQYQQAINALKAAYTSDIKNLLTNFVALTSDTKYQTLIDNIPSLTIVFAAADMITQIKAGRSVAELLYNMGHADYTRKTKPNDYNAMIKLASLISWSVTDLRLGTGKPTNMTWVKAALLNSLKTNADLFKVFMGLFTQQASGIKIGDFDFHQKLIDNNAAVLKGQYLIYNISATTNAVINALATQNPNPSFADRAAQYIDVATQIINLADKCLGVLPSSSTVKERAFVQDTRLKYLPIIRQTDSVVYSIEQQQYSNAIYQADTLLAMVFVDNTDGGKIREVFRQYGLFIAAIAESKSADDVKSAISAFALPTGSSRIKKQNFFSWGLNGYVGVYHTWNLNYQNTGLPATEWGITAPLGLSLNWGHFLGGGAFSVYGGIIDIAAIFTYKVNSDNSVNSTIEFGQILSPSLGLVYGFPVNKKNYNLPLSLGANVQWGPRLQKVSENGNSVLPMLTPRINLFLAIDIPVINFHVSPFKK